MRSKNEQAGPQIGIGARVGLELLIEAIYMIDVALCGYVGGCADCGGGDVCAKSSRCIELTAQPQKDGYR